MNSADALVQRIYDGDREALKSLFVSYRSRLHALVQLRIDARLRSRIDPSDVLQEAFLDVTRRAEEYFAAPNVPPFIWLRSLTINRMQSLHRTHLGTQRRDIRSEIAAGSGDWSSENSMILSDRLAGQLSSPSGKLLRSELSRILHAAIETMEPIDREILALRHFEELGNLEVAAVLSLKPAAASNRYVRAMLRLREVLQQQAAFFELP